MKLTKLMISIKGHLFAEVARMLNRTKGYLLTVLFCDGLLMFTHMMTKY